MNKASAALLKELEKYRGLAEASFEGIAIHDRGKILATNQAAANIFGYPVSDLIGKSILDFVTPDSVETVMKSMASREGKAYEFMARKKDGSTFPAEGVGKEISYHGEKVRVVRIKDITERRLAERYLKESGELYHAFMKASPDAVAIVDLQGRLFDVSKKYVEMFGFDSEKELIGTDGFERVFPGDREKVKGIFPLLLKEGFRQSNQYRLARKDGGIFIGEISSAVIKNPDGSPTAVVSIIRDITDRKLAEEAIRYSAELYQAFMRASPDAVFVDDLEGKFLDASRRAAQMFGYDSPEELKGKTIFELNSGEENERAQKQLAVLLKDGSKLNSQYQLRRKDGSIFFGEINSSVMKNPDGSPKAILSIIRDITDRKKSEEATKELAELYQAFMQASPDAVAITDTNGRYLDLSQRNVEMLGYRSAKEIIGKNVMEIIAPEDHERAIKGFQEILKEGGRQRSEYRVRRKDGSILTGEISTAIIRDSNGYPKAVIGITRDITERIRTQDLIHEKMEYYQKLVMASPNAVVVSDLQGKITEISERVIEDYGEEDAKKLIGMNSFELIDPEDRERAMKNLQRTLTEGFVSHMEYKMHRIDGTTYYGDLNAALIRDKEGKPKAFIATIRDVTERKRAEEALRESEQQYRHTFDSMSDMIHLSDTDCRILMFNTAFRKFDQEHGLPTDVVGKNLFEVFPFLTEAVRKEYEQVFESGKTLITEETNRIQDKEYITETRKIPVVEKGKVVRIITVVRDVTERKRAFEALAASEERFRTLVSSMDEVVFTTDRSHRCTGIYGHGLGKLGYPLHEFVGKTYGEIFHDQTSLPLELHERALSGENVVYEYSREHGGETYFFQITLAPMRDQSGAITGLVGVSRDITKLKKLEENLAKAEKLESLGILAGGIAHDFNNILTAIVGNISIAKVGCEDRVTAFQNLDEAEKAAMRAKNLTQQLLTFSLGGAPIKTAVDVGKLLADSANFILKGSKSRVILEKCDRLWIMDADESQMSQVFNNLLINADQAMPNGGNIQVICENVLFKENNELHLAPGQYVKISVHDQGVGIPKEYLPKIFDPYFTTKQTGSGLGLTIAYSIINKHGGHLSVESESGQGTTFTVYLPASQAKPAQAPKEEERTVTGRGKILVMDDDAGVRRVAQNMLQSLGFQVELAKDGAEAVALYKTAMDSGQPFDLVIMDLVVPAGMGGKEAMEKLRQTDPEVKAIVSSGYSTDPIMAEYENYGFAGVITKPYGLKKLKEVLQSIKARNKN